MGAKSVFKMHQADMEIWKYVSALIYQYHVFYLRLTLCSVTNEHLMKNTTQMQSCPGFCGLQKELLRMQKKRMTNKKTKSFKTFSLHMKLSFDTCYKRRRKWRQHFCKRIHSSEFLCLTQQKFNWPLQRDTALVCLCVTCDLFSD